MDVKLICISKYKLYFLTLTGLFSLCGNPVFADDNYINGTQTLITEESREGRKNFNSRCAHCHAADGQSGQKDRDLRRLGKKYSGEWQAVAYEVIKEGKPNDGMPKWGDVLGDKDIKEILVFLSMVQK